MASTTEGFNQEVITERELSLLMPDWPPGLVRDYISFKRNLATTADARDVTDALVLNNTQEISGNEIDIAKLRAVINTQNRKIKSNVQLIAELLSDSGKLAARLNSIDKKVDLYSFNRLIGTGTQGVTSTLTPITWNASNDSLGTDVTFSGGSPTRLTAVTTGSYKIGGYVAIESSEQRAQAAVEILINGVATGLQRGGSYVRNSGTSYDYWTMDVSSTPFNLSASDYVELGVGQVTGASYGYSGVLTISCDRSVSEFWMERIA